MKYALDIAGLVFLGTLGFGLLLAGLFILSIMRKLQEVPALPLSKQPPSHSLTKISRALEATQHALKLAEGPQADALNFHLRRLEAWQLKIEKILDQDNNPYFRALAERESFWKKWKELHAQGTGKDKTLRSAARSKLPQIEGMYQRAQMKVDDEWRAAVARDQVAGEEAASVGLFTLPQVEQKIPEPPPPPPPPEGFSQVDIMASHMVTPGTPYLDSTLSLEGAPEGILKNMNLAGCSFAGVIFTGMHHHKNCDFSQGDLQSVQLLEGENPHQFVDCQFQNTNLEGAYLAYTLFSRCDFSGATFGGATLRRVKFIGCTMDGIHWDGVDLSKTVMSDDMLESVDFTGVGKHPRNHPNAEAEAEMEPVPVTKAGAGALPQTPGGTPPPDLHAQKETAPESIASVPKVPEDKQSENETQGNVASKTASPERENSEKENAPLKKNPIDTHLRK